MNMDKMTVVDMDTSLIPQYHRDAYNKLILAGYIPLNLYATTESRVRRLGDKPGMDLKEFLRTVVLQGGGTGFVTVRKLEGSWKHAPKFFYKDKHFIYQASVSSIEKCLDLRARVEDITFYCGNWYLVTETDPYKKSEVEL